MTQVTLETKHFKKRFADCKPFFFHFVTQMTQMTLETKKIISLWSNSSGIIKIDFYGFCYYFVTHKSIKS